MRLAGWGLVLLLAVGMLVLEPPRTVHATTYTVTCGSTIQSAIDGAVANDTVFVQAGCTHFERLRIYRPLHLVGESRSGAIIDGQGMGTVVSVNSSNVEVRGFTIRNSDDFGWGVHVEGANRVNITGNIISASPDGDGVNLVRANSTLVSGNIFSSNLYGVNVTSSNSVRILNNLAVANDTIGVQLQFSSRSLVFNNTFAGGEDGVDLVQSSFNNVTRNLIKGMTIFGVLLITSSYHTPPSQFPQNNTVIENTFQKNHIGVNLQNATLNTFYHNDFFLGGFRHANPVASIGSTVEINAPNYWDGSKRGVLQGNYWDNYTGVDGNGDGIGDTPYVIDASNQDGYPLMSPFLPVPVLVRSVVASPLKGNVPLTVSFSAQVLGSLTPFSYSWSFGDGSPAVTAVSPSHTFSSAGNFTVTLTLVDTSGSSDSLSVRVQASPVPPFPFLVPVVAGVVAVVVVGGLLFWRRRRRGVKGLKAAGKR